MMQTTTSFRALWSRVGLLAALGLATVGAAGAQTAPAWASVWRSASPNATSYGAGRSIALAADGSQYITGEFVGTLTLGTVTLTAGAGTAHTFLAKYSAAGAVLWARQMDGGGSSPSIQVAADAAGNAYVAGSLYTTITLGGTTLTSANADSYLAKFDAQGTQQWVRQGGAGTSASGITTDASGNVALAGYAGNLGVFGGPVLPGTGIYYCKLSPTGTTLQAVRVATGTSGFASDVKLALDGADNAYVAGGFSGRPTLGSTTLVSTGGSDIFLCKLNAAGIPVWAQRIGGPNDDGAGGVAVDAAGNAVVCGSSEYVLSGSGASPLGSVMHVARFSAQGTPLWAQLLGPTYTGSGISGAANSFMGGVVYDGRGGYLVAGQLAGTTTFGNTMLTALGQQAFVARYDGQGNVVWADHAVGSSPTDISTGLSIAANASGRVYVLGTAVGSVAFGAVPTTTTVSGRADVFVAQLTAGSVLATRPASLGIALETYPNPATGSTTLVLPAGGGQLVVLDAVGRAVRAQALPIAAGACLVSLAGLAPGFYQLRATLGSGQIAYTTLQVQ